MMNYDPLVSICLCVYNGEKYLAKQLESLSNQTHRNVEIIIIDDCSVDESLEIAIRHSLQDTRIRIIKNEVNLGYVRNFEKAFSLSVGQYIAPCDQDDVWMPEKLEALVRAIGNSSAVYCDSKLVDAEGSDLGVNISDGRNMYRGNNPWVFVFGNCVSGHALMFNRDLLKALLPFPNIRFHDWWIAFVAASANGIEYVPRALVEYRQHTGSVCDFSSLKKSENSKSFQVAEDYRSRSIWLEAIANVHGPQQAAFKSLSCAWDARERGFFIPSMLYHVLRNRSAMLFIRSRDSKIQTLLSYSLGVAVVQRLQQFKTKWHAKK